ncbi:TetR/AcrR family transcriptional regulator [Nonomuraea longicatena]|uniref:TetR family transcriptional regulator n=1 Tax=Nonomuraea longicatena TaxID=83682 RepID=A0ABP4B2V7_9ACTN
MTTADHGSDTRGRILTAAQRLFAERGYAATSLADIAAEVGLTKTAVAYHFHPKGKLAAELIAPAADDILRMLSTSYDTREALVEAMVTAAVRHRAVIRLLMDDLGSAEQAPPGTPGELIGHFRAEILARLTGPDPDERATVRGWALLGAVHWGVVHTMELPEDVVLEQLLKTAAAF